MYGLGLISNYSAGGYKFMNNEIGIYIQHITTYPFISNIFKVFNANLSFLLDCSPYSSQIRKKTFATYIYDAFSSFHLNRFFSA